MFHMIASSYVLYNTSIIDDEESYVRFSSTYMYVLSFELARHNNQVPNYFMDQYYHIYDVMYVRSYVSILVLFIV